MKTSTIEQDKHAQTQTVLLGVQRLEKNVFCVCFIVIIVYIFYIRERLLTNTNILSRPSSSMEMAFRWLVDDSVNFQGGGGVQTPKIWNRA